MYVELDVVELSQDRPDLGLRVGSRGTVVEVFDEPEKAYLVDFSDAQGQVLVIEVFRSAELRLIWRRSTESAKLAA